MRSLLTKWYGDVMFVNGRPRHSQSQGLIERGNREVEKKMASMKNQHGFGPAEKSFPWASWLPEIMFTLNTQNHETIKNTPYNLVYGRQPLNSRTLPNEEEERNVIYEEELLGISVPVNLDDPSEYQEDVHEMGLDNDVVSMDEIADNVDEVPADGVSDNIHGIVDEVATDVLMGDSLIIEAESDSSSMSSDTFNDLIQD